MRRSIRKYGIIFFLNPSETPNSRETFKFNSTAAPPHVQEMKDFEDKLADMIENIKKREYINSFQTKLKKDAIKIAKEKKLIVSADKTHNFYKMSVIDYDELVEKNVTKDYKKAEDNLVDEIMKVDKEIATELDLGDRIYCTSKKDAYITLKDHKPSFANKPTCRLINTTKTELGKISKQKLSKIISEVKLKTKHQKWKNSDSVIVWFIKLENKKVFPSSYFIWLNFFLQ